MDMKCNGKGKAEKEKEEERKPYTIQFFGNEITIGTSRRFPRKNLKKWSVKERKALRLAYRIYHQCLLKGEEEYKELLAVAASKLVVVRKNLARVELEGTPCLVWEWGRGRDAQDERGEGIITETATLLYTIKELLECACKFRRVARRRGGVIAFATCLEGIEKEFGVTWSYRKGMLVVTTIAPIVLKDTSMDLAVNMGKFKIEMPLRTDWCGIRVSRVIDGDANADVRGKWKPPSYIHPHVNTDGYLCLGDYGKSIRAAWERLDLDSYLHLVLEILRNYNSGSPYVRLSEYVEGCSCIRCGGFILLEHMGEESVVCERCKRVMHRRCANHTCICGTKGIYCRICCSLHQRGEDEEGNAVCVIHGKPISV